MPSRLLPITINKLFQHWDMQIKLKRFKTRPLLMKVKPISWSELWRLKRTNYLKRLKRCKKCSKSSIWASWTQVFSMNNWKSSTKPDKNWDTILKSWTIWQWPKKKRCNNRKNNSNPKPSLMSRDLIYLIWTKILNWVEKSTTKLIRSRLKLVREEFNLQMTLKSEVWELERVTLWLLNNKINSWLLHWMLDRTVMFIWMVIVWQRKFKSFTWIVFPLEPIICLLLWSLELSPDNKLTRGRLSGILLKMSFIWRKKLCKKKLWKKSKEKLRKKMKP